MHPQSSTAGPQRSTAPLPTLLDERSARIQVLSVEDVLERVGAQVAAITRTPRAPEYASARTPSGGSTGADRHSDADIDPLVEARLEREQFDPADAEDAGAFGWWS